MAALLAVPLPVLPAQRFVATARSVGPVTVTCAVPGQPAQTATAPAGTPAGSIALQALVNAANGFASGAVVGSLTGTAADVTLQLDETLTAYGAASATAGPHELRLDVQSTVPANVVVEIEWTAQLDPALPAPLVRVDVADDGVDDFLGLFPGQRASVPTTIGATPFAIRTRTGLVAPGGMLATQQSRLRVTVRAASEGIADELAAVLACGEALAVQPDLEQNLTLRIHGAQQPGVLAFLVVGFAPAPLVLPNGCVLHPQGDLVAPLGPAGLSVDMTRLRGLSFVAQAVSLAAQGNPVRSSTAWSVRLP